jgi:hypothetical protein
LGKTIWAVKDARFMLNHKVILHKAGNGMAGALTKFVWVVVIPRVCMVRMDNDLVSKEEVVPLLKATINGSEFFVIDIIVGLCFRKGLRMVTNHVWLPLIIMLEENGTCSVVKGIHLKFEWFTQVQVYKDWLRGNLVNKLLDHLDT